MVLRHDGYAGPFSLAGVDAIAAGRLLQGHGPFTRHVNHKAAGGSYGRLKALRALHDSMKRGSVGDVYSIHDRHNDEVLRTRECQESVKLINTNGNDKADRCWSAGKNEFPHCTFLGAYVCKHIVGTSTMSQHSYGNAVDFGAATMAQLYSIADWMLAHQRELDIQTIIVGAKVWTPAEHWHAYTGDYHYHVHVDFQPSFAGPCGVRNR